MNTFSNSAEPITSDDEPQIRTLVQRWAAAVNAGDLDGVLDPHGDDIVMFDVPPPQNGVRGRAAYRAAWPGFLEWQRHDGVFELVSLEVTAGTDVAFAHALLRCGTHDDLDRNPDQRLRLTLGLRKQDGRWLITHEHHSFPDASALVDAAGEEDLRVLHDRWFTATATKDLDAMMAVIATDVVSYEHQTPLQYVGVDAVRQVCQAGLDAGPEVRWTVPDLQLLVRDDLAVGWGLNRIEVQTPDGSPVVSWSRGTRIFRKTTGSWQLIHQQVSYPRDPLTGQAAVDLHL